MRDGERRHEAPLAAIFLLLDFGRCWGPRWPRRALAVLAVARSVDAETGRVWHHHGGSLLGKILGQSERLSGSR